MIDLKSVVEKYPESLNSAEKLRAYLTDLYPSEKAKVGIVVSIFSCGIADEIKRMSLSSALIVTDEFLKNSGATAKLENSKYLYSVTLFIRT